MVSETYKGERLGQGRYVADHVAAGKVPVDVVLADLVEFSYEAVDGLPLRLALLDRQAHGEEIFQDVIQERRHVLVNLERRSFGRQPASGILQEEKSYFRCETRQKDLHVATYLKNVRDILGNVDDEENLRSLSITEVVINVQQRQRRPQLLHVYHQRRHRRWSQGINRQIAAKLLNCHPDGARIELLT